MPQSVELEGRLEAANEDSLRPPVRGRIENLYFRAGDQVVPGDVIAQVLDLTLQAEIDRLSAHVGDLQARAQERVRVVPVGPSPVTVRALQEAETRHQAASASVAALTEAFNRREIGFAQLEEARGAERQQRAQIDALRQRLAAERNRTRVETIGAPDVVIDELAQVVARREGLEARLRVQMVAQGTGVLVQAGPEPPRSGLTVQPSEPLFQVVDGRNLLLQLVVPGAQLGAVEAAGSGTLEPEGQSDGRVIALGPPGAAAGPDGAFPLTAQLDNADGRLRPGQRATVTVTLPDISALRWLFRQMSGER